MGVYLLMAVCMQNTVLSSTFRMEAGISSKMMEHFCHTKEDLCALGPCRPHPLYIHVHTVSLHGIIS